MGTAVGLVGGTVGIVLAAFVVILAILWVMLPFAVFGIRKRLDASIALEEQLLHEIRMANYLTKVVHNFREEKNPDGTVRIVRSV